MVPNISDGVPMRASSDESGPSTYVCPHDELTCEPPAPWCSQCGDFMKRKSPPDVGTSVPTPAPS
jgi:hypothetical protein